MLAVGGAAYLDETARLRLTLNGQDFVEHVPRHDLHPVKGFTFSWPHVSIVMPPTGPRDGGRVLTLSGSGFDGGWAYRCRFVDGSTIVGAVEATYSHASDSVTCPSVAYAITSMLTVQLSLDGTTYSSDSAGFFSMDPQVPLTCSHTPSSHTQPSHSPTTRPLAAVIARC